jgi:hypothetical protein
MAILAEPASLSTLGAAAALQWITTLWQIPTIQRVTFRSGPGVVHVWVQFRTEDEPGFAQAVEAEIAFLRDPSARHIDIHYEELDRINPDLLPEGKILFERP